MASEKFSLKKRLRSFKHAFAGLGIMLKAEHNFRIHLLAALVTIFCSCFFKIAYFEWLIVLLLIGWVLCLEIINSCIEQTMNFMSTDKHPTIKKIKNLAAAAVLVSAITAFVIGLIIFVPKIYYLIFG